MSKVKVVFGLEAQGHIPTIEAILKKWNSGDVNMTFARCVWQEVGEAIGWEPLTACLKYFEWKEKKEKLIHDPNCTHGGDSLTDWKGHSILCLNCNSIVSENGNNLEKPKPVRITSYS